MQKNRIYHWSKNFEQINNLLTKLDSDSDFKVPSFLLRAQLIEYALKSLLIHAPYKFDDFDTDKVGEKTMGGVISDLKKCGDAHLNKLIEAASSFVIFRNEITHHLVNGGRSFEEIENDIKKHLDVAENIEKGIIYFAEYVEQTLGVNFDEINA